MRQVFLQGERTSIKITIARALKITTIIIISIFSIISISAAQNHYSNGEPYKEWEKLYIEAGRLTTLAFQTNDQNKRDKLLLEATRLYRKALEIYPSEVNTMNNLAANLYFLGRINESLSIYTMIIEKSLNVYSAYMGRAKIYEDMGEYVKALKDYETFMRIVYKMPQETRPKSVSTVIEAIDRLKKRLELDYQHNLHDKSSGKKVIMYLLLHQMFG